MAEFNLDEFRASIGKGEGQNVVPLDTGAAEVLPLSTNAAFDISGFRQSIGDTTAQNLPPTRVTATPSMTPAERFGRQTPEGDFIPFDVKRGLGDSLTEWRIAMQSGPEAKLSTLQKIYPDKRARILPTGDLTIELTDSETGKTKEVLLDPDGLGANELMELAAQTPEIAAGIAAAVATRGTGLAKTAANIILSSLASGAAGTVKDFAMRGAEGIPIDSQEIGSRRSSEAAMDMFLQGGLYGVGRGFRALSPFAREIKPGSKEFDVVSGQQFFERAFGEKIALTPAEVTGSKALSALEAAEAPQPGSRTVMSKFREKTNEQMSRIQKRAVGTPMSEEEIGESSIGIVRRQLVEPLERALETVRTTAAAKGEARISRLLDESTGMVRGEAISPTQAGTSTLKQFDTKLAEAETKVNAAYDVVKSLPGGSGDVLSGTAAADAAKEIRAELPKVLKEMEVETGLLDELGRPITAMREKEILLKSGVPEGLLTALNDLETIRGGKVSLQTLTNMKKSAHDAIAAFKTAHGDVKDRWFKKIAGAYEKGIQEGIDATENIELKDALVAAKNTYKKELLPFERPGLKELAKDEFTGGRLSPEQVVDRFFEGPKAVENYRMLKEVLGENSPAFRVMKRSWADTQLEAVADPITKSIQPRNLQMAIKKLPPELRKEMFGKNADALDNALNLQSGIKDLKSIDSDQMKVLLSLKDPTKSDFEAVLTMQKNVNKAYANSLIGDVADGLPVASKITGPEFVKRITNSDIPTKDVKRVLDAIAAESPETRDAIATHTFYDLLDKASFREADTAGKLISGEPLNLSPLKLADALGRPGTAQRNRYELLLGSDKLPVAPPRTVKDRLGRETVDDTNPTRLEVLENIVKTLAPREGREKAFSAAGGIGAGAQIQNLFRNPLRYATSYAKKAALTALYLGPMAKLTSNRAFTGPELAAVANTMIASEPFARRLMELTADEAIAAEIASDLKQSIDRFLDEWTDSPEGRESSRTGAFMQGQDVPMTIGR